MLHRKAIIGCAIVDDTHVDGITQESLALARRLLTWCLTEVDTPFGVHQKVRRGRRTRELSSSFQQLLPEAIHKFECSLFRLQLTMFIVSRSTSENQKLTYP